MKLAATTVLSLFLGGSTVSATLRGSDKSLVRNLGSVPCGDDIVVDFSKTAAGVELNGGDVIDDSVLFEGGVTFKARRSPGPYKDGMLFDSNIATGNDIDLTTFKFLKNMFIISEDNNSSNPDDAAKGGEIWATFSSPVTLKSIRLVDVNDGKKGSDLTLYDINGNRLKGIKLTGMTNGGQKVLKLSGERGIGSFKIRLMGSGAIDDVTFALDCDDTLPACDVDDLTFDGLDDDCRIEVPANSTSEGSYTVDDVCFQLPSDVTNNNVDVFLLFDDTGSFSSQVPVVGSIFSSMTASLEAAFPLVEFGFGVGRYEDYAGSFSLSGENPNGRPFLLNQPIVTRDDALAAGGVDRDTLIGNALGRTAAGFGGDGPESAIEALYQVATGAGFDGDGDGSTTGTDGTQVAGATLTQTSADTSGDVPDFATLASFVVSSGSVGGVGFRKEALKLVILATDICTISPFDPVEGIPANVTGLGAADVEPVSAFACGGNERFGFVSDSKTGPGSITGAVAPLGSATVPEAIAALNEEGIRVIGLGSGASPTSSTLPSTGPSVFLSALGRLTGAVDGSGTPFVLNLGSSGDDLKAAIEDAITFGATASLDVLLEVDDAPAGLNVTITPTTVTNVGPGEEACFSLEFSSMADASELVGGTVDLLVEDANGGTVLGAIPVAIVA